MDAIDNSKESDVKESDVRHSDSIEVISIPVPKCVICSTELDDEPNLLTLKCCSNVHVHNSCLRVYLQNNINNKCQYCQTQITTDIDTNYIVEDEYYPYDPIFYDTILSIFFLIARIYLLIFTIINILDIYSNNKGHAYASMFIYIISTIASNTWILFVRFFISVIIPNESKEKYARHISTIQQIIQLKYTNSLGILCGYTMHPDKKYIYFRPLYCCCTGRYKLTNCDWIKLYCIQMMIYVFPHALLDLAYTYLVKYNYIAPGVHITLQILTWCVIYTSCICSGDNYGRDMHFTETKVIKVINKK